MRPVVSVIVRAFLSFPGELSRLIRRQAVVFIAASVLIAIVVAGSSSLVGYLHDRQIEESVRNAKTASYLLSEQIDRSLQVVSFSVSSVAARLLGAKPSTVDDLDSLALNDDLQAFARSRVAEEPLLDNVAIVGADGRIVHASGDRSYGGVITDERMLRDYMRRVRRTPSAGAYVSSPLQSMDGPRGAGVAKRVSSPSGDLLGVVSGAVKETAIDDLFKRFLLGERGSIGLFRTDGAMITRVPAVDLMLGRDITSGDVYTQYISRGVDGVVRKKSAIDEVDRIFSVTKTPHFPVAVVVTVATVDALADWFRQAGVIAAGALALVLMIGAGAFKLAIRIDQLSETRERAAVQAQLAVQYKRFNTAMDNIVQGVAMYDAEMRLITCNKRYGEIYGLPAALTRPGATNAEALFHRRGDHGVANVSREVRTDSDGSIVIVNELSDGRIILQRKKGLADGGWVSTHEDITARRRAEEKVREMATKDPLTGLSNRFEFRQRLDQCIAEVRRKTGKFAVFYLDLDHFKAVNDNLGHPLGDKLLQEVAARINAAIHDGDTVARLGGDEFAIIQRITNTLNDPVRLAERLISSISEPYAIDGNAILIGASVGISLTPNDSLDADELIRGADMALYQSKAQGRGNYNFFKASMDEQVRARRHMEDDLRAALAGEQFHLHFQPVVSVADRSIKSFEALLRWRHPTRGNVPPGEFISLAEEIGLIVPIGEWVVREACKEAATWPRHIKVAVNVSAVQFKSPGLIQAISEAIEAAGIDGSRLIVEVTESVMIDDAEQAIAVLHSIRDRGISIAMDDFGTGYSSLSYLRRFPFDKIKIDRSFVSELGEREGSVAIVRAITSLATALGMQTVAEGVETEEQFARLGFEGCNEVQGYLIGRPMPPPDVLTFLRTSPSEIRIDSFPPPSSADKRRADAEPIRSAPRAARPSPSREARRVATARPVWRLLVSRASAVLDAAKPHRLD